MNVLKELSLEGILSVLSNYIDIESLKSYSKEAVEVVAEYYISSDEIDEIEFIIELDGE
tara:strand:- start:713 stop:889 length:177 start_codon:yes stop_codon:yes gene_type:complete